MSTIKYNHQQVFALALPMMVSNISTPLLGLVDTAVMGHLEHAKFLAAAALGGLIFNFIFWACGFLRMSTTGITAQAFGQNKMAEVQAILMRALLIALVLALIILSLQTYIRNISLNLLESSTKVSELAGIYFDIRIWSAPATLSHYVLLGWFIGVQDVKSPLLMVLFSNISNIILDIILVAELHWDIRGVALATVIAEYSSLLFGLLLLKRKLKILSAHWHWKRIFHGKKLKALLVINQHIFVRNLCIIFTLAFFTAQGARFGDAVLAANSVLLNFIMFMSYALDGLAHAAEALIGKALGQKNKALFKQTLSTTRLWSALFALMFALFYYLFGVPIIKLLSDIDIIRNTAIIYLPWLILTPGVSFYCFLLDGVFIGATWSKAMRDTMIFSVLCCYMPAWYYSRAFENHGLWLALCVFFLARTLSMSVVFVYKQKHINKQQLQ